MRALGLLLLGCALTIGSMQASLAQAPAPANPPPPPPAAETRPPANPPAPAAPPAAPIPAPAPAPAPAASAPAGPVYNVTYFEVAPAAARKTAALLRQFAAATRKEDGNSELTVLHEIGRPGRFAIVEGWRDKAASDAHAAAMKALGDKLQPAIASPFESRQFLPLAMGPAASGDLSTAILVLTHVDVFPAGKDEVAALVKAQAEASLKDLGVARFDAVIWDGHPNHFHLIEAWSDRKALIAHALTDHTKEFRAKVTPFEGAFYDERLYEVVKKSD